MAMSSTIPGALHHEHNHKRAHYDATVTVISNFEQIQGIRHNPFHFRPVIYCVIQYLNYPLFTYWPAVRRFVWGYGAESAADGPNMLWYGWTVTTILIASALSVVAMFIPEHIIKNSTLVGVALPNPDYSLCSLFVDDVVEARRQRVSDSRKPAE
jgi:hypothetical protein